jgi:tetratricopeptide (TPR) repeat protein
MLVVLASCGTLVTATEAAEVYYNLGNAYYDAGRYDDAIKAYQRARELDPSKRIADYHLVRVHIEAGDLEEAERVLDGLLAQDPSNAVLLETLAYLELLRGDRALAVELYEKLYSDRPQKASVWANLVALYVDLERWDDAIAVLRERQQAGEDVRVQIGDTYYEAGRYGEAADTYLLLPEIGDAEVAGRLIEALFETERYAEGLAELKALTEQFPSSSRLSFLYAWLLYAVVEDDVTGRTTAIAALDGGYADTAEWRRFLEIERVQADEELARRVQEVLDAESEASDVQPGS